MDLPHDSDSLTSATTADPDTWLATAHKGDAFGRMLAVALILSIVPTVLVKSGDPNLMRAGLMCWLAIWFIFLVRNSLARFVAQVTGYPADRLRRIGECHVAVTPAGLIIDSPKQTQFLPWSGIKTVPAELVVTGSASPPVNDVPVITGRGRVLDHRGSVRRINRWVDSNVAEPAEIVFDLRTLRSNTPRFRKFLEVLRTQLAKVPARSAPPAPRPGPSTPPQPQDHQPVSTPKQKIGAHSRDGRPVDQWISETSLTYTGAILLALSIIGLALAILAGLVVSLVTLPFADTALLVIAAVVFAFVIAPVTRAVLRGVGLPTDRLRWAGCHLAATQDGLIITSRRRTDWLAWSEMSEVVWQPMDPQQAHALTIPVIVRPTIIGPGRSRRHWFPIRHIGPFRGRPGSVAPVAVDLEVFFSPDETARLLWPFRPDLARALGYSQPAPTQSEPLTPPDSAGPPQYVLDALEPGASHTVALKNGSVTVARRADGAGVQVSGAHLPTVTITRSGASTHRRSPIGSYDARQMSVVVDGVPWHMSRIARHPLSLRRHQFAVDDGRGHLISLDPSYLVSGNEMSTRLGIRREGWLPDVQRTFRGRLNFRTSSPDDAQQAQQLAVGLALATAFGTRTLMLKNIPLIPLLVFTQPP